MAPTAPQGPRCPTREANTRCLFVEGHPGPHVCVASRGSMVFLVGSGALADDEWCCPIPSAAEGGERGDALWGEWTAPMLVRLVRELREAGARAPRRWNANLDRLRGLEPSGA